MLSFSNTIIQVLFCTAITLSAFAKDIKRPYDYSYKVVAGFPHDPSVFTQGLAFSDGKLYESGGLYGQSSANIRLLDDVSPLINIPLESKYFAEGLTVFSGAVYQLTWRSELGFIYDSETLRHKGTFRFEGEGWGLCHNGRELILSNGSDQLQFISIDTLETVRRVKVTLAGQPLHALNELEWVDGLIYANVWQSNWIVMIDPESGYVLGRVDLTNLLPIADRRIANVLNGIAYDEKKQRLFVTGKNWPRLYQLELNKQEISEAK